MTSLFKPKVNVPAVTPAAPMPDAQAPEVREARRRDAERIMGRAGRSSTILTSPSSRKSEDSYTAKTLGAE